VTGRVVKLYGTEHVIYYIHKTVVAEYFVSSWRNFPVVSDHKNSLKFSRSLSDLIRCILRLVVHASLCRLGDVVVSVLATGPQGSWFQTWPRRWIFKGDKFRSTTFFVWEVKPEVPCRKIIRRVKDPLRYLRYWIGKILTPSSFPPTCPRCLCW